METFFWFVITLLIAFACGVFAVKLRIPVGGLIGGMIGVAVFNVLSGRGYMYSYVRVGVQICLGAMSGSRIGRNEFKNMKKFLFPLLLIITVCIVLNIVFGLVIMSVTELDISTALLSITPGGATDMIFVAEDIGADTGTVGLLQSLRMIFCNGILPIIFIALISRQNGGGKAEEKTGKKNDVVHTKKMRQEKDFVYYAALVRMFVFATAGGLLFKALKVPGGNLVGAMIFTVMQNCIWGNVKYPQVMKKYQQVFTGAYIGLGITMKTLGMLPSLTIAMSIILIDIMVYVFLMSSVLRKVTDLDYGTGLLCSTPGGIGEVSILSEEMGTDTACVALLNTFRMILVVATFPVVIKFIAQLCETVIS